MSDEMTETLERYSNLIDQIDEKRKEEEYTTNTLAWFKKHESLINEMNSLQEKLASTIKGTLDTGGIKNETH